MTWQYSDFLRIACLAASRHEALAAIESRIDKLRVKGWEIPQDSFVEIRPSGFGFAASLCLPERCRRGPSYVLRRWVEPRGLRRKSDTFPLYEATSDVLPEPLESAIVLPNGERLSSPAAEQDALARATATWRERRHARKLAPRRRGRS